MSGVVVEIGGGTRSFHDGDVDGRGKWQRNLTRSILLVSRRGLQAEFRQNVPVVALQ